MIEHATSHPGYPPMRLRTRDYSAPALYFVTICASQYRCVLSRIVDKRVVLTALGKIVREVWLAIPTHFPNFALHEFVIMPNHVHGILETTTRLQHAAPLQSKGSRSLGVGSLSVIVRSFKGEVSRCARLELNWHSRLWQPNYFDRVIRDDREFASASRYIAENPLRSRAKIQQAQEIKERRAAQHAAPLQRRSNVTV